MPRHSELIQGRRSQNEIDSPADPTEQDEGDPKKYTTNPEKPIFAPGTESMMRTQLIGVFNTSETKLKSTTEQKQIEKKHRDVIEATVKAQRKAIKSKTIEDAKAEKLRQYKQFMANKLVQKMGELNAQQQREKKEAELEERRKRVEMGLEEEAEAEKVEEEEAPGEEWLEKGQGEVYGVAGELLTAEEQKQERAARKSRFKSEGVALTEEQGNLEEAAPHKPRQSKQQRPADWYNHEYQEGDEYTDVGAESVESVASTIKPKMFNVAIQVSPKSKAQIHKTAPWTKHKPKMYDVAVGVGPSDFARIVRRPMNYEELQAIEEEEEEEEEAEEEEQVGAPEAIWEEEFIPPPNWETLTHHQREKLKSEHEQFLRTRKISKRADASTLARPTYYRELPLNASMEVICINKDTQVSEYDIEKEDAEQRGLSLEENNILWPTIKEFDITIGERKLDDYIRRCWKLDKEWLYHIQLLQIHTTDYRKKYIFEVIFSIPTKEFPVPPATASVFFVFEVGKFIHIDDMIKVSYVLEGTRYPHVPGQVQFQQKWLSGIVQDKLRIQRAIDF